MTVASKSKTAAQKVAERQVGDDYTKMEEGRDFARRFSLTLWELLREERSSITRNGDEVYTWHDGRSQEQRQQHLNDFDVMRSDQLLDYKVKYFLPAPDIVDVECGMRQQLLYELNELEKPPLKRDFRDQAPILVNQFNLGKVLVLFESLNRKTVLEERLTSFTIRVDPAFKLDIAAGNFAQVRERYMEETVKKGKTVKTGIERYK